MTFSPGRGAGVNPSGRFRTQQTERDPGEESSPKTIFMKDSSKSILTKNDSPDIPFNLSVNPYRGCEHGCSYCYARPTHEYLDLSAGLDFESRILVKEEAPRLLRAELMKKSYRPERINLSGITDCYQPIEREKRITRGCLEVLTEFQNPFVIITKNRLVTRDIDLFRKMALLNGVAIFVSVTSLDEKLAGELEPRASRPQGRLNAIAELAEAGIPVGVMVAPVIPSLNDHEMPAILEAAALAGARWAGFTPLRLPYGVKEVFGTWLEEHYPERKERVLSRVREMRGGALNDSDFSQRMTGTGENAGMLKQLFDLHCRKFGLNREKLVLDAGHFSRPGEQLTLGL